MHFCLQLLANTNILFIYMRNARFILFREYIFKEFIKVSENSDIKTQLLIFICYSLIAQSV
jgi:hypothetical protein